MPTPIGRPIAPGIMVSQSSMNDDITAQADSVNGSLTSNMKTPAKKSTPSALEGISPHPLYSMASPLPDATGCYVPPSSSFSPMNMNMHMNMHMNMNMYASNSNTNSNPSTVSSFNYWTTETGEQGTATLPRPAISITHTPIRNNLNATTTTTTVTPVQSDSVSAGKPISNTDSKISETEAEAPPAPVSKPFKPDKKTFTGK